MKAPFLDPDAVKCPSCGLRSAHRSVYVGGKWLLQCTMCGHRE